MYRRFQNAAINKISKVIKNVAAVILTEFYIANAKKLQNKFEKNDDKENLFLYICIWQELIAESN